MALKWMGGYIEKAFIETVWGAVMSLNITHHKLYCMLFLALTIPMLRVITLGYVCQKVLVAVFSRIHIQKVAAV
jgi:hypothetical protein